MEHSSIQAVEAFEADGHLGHGCPQAELQMRLLIGSVCPHLQGFLIGRATPHRISN